MAVGDAHKNFAYSLIAVAPIPASSGTSITVTTGQGALFPAVPFNACIWPAGANPLTTNAEIVRVTLIVTDVLTITRAQESSAARTVVVGDQIAATISVKTLTDLENLFTANADGMQSQGGTTPRMLKWSGSDIIIVGSGSNVYTYPSATDTLVGRASIDTLTNKRVDPATNTIVGGIYSLTANQASTNATTVLVGASWTMPANFASVGTVIKVRVHYRFVKTTSPPTLTCNLNVGGSAVVTFVITSVSSAITAGGVLEATLTVITTGAGGTMMCAMVGSNDHGITNATNWNIQLVDIATDAIDTTASKVISVDMKQTTAVASNTLTISQGYVEIVKL